ncbi:MAG: hypothetical protein HY789_06410 [Deltaproteobacteria bacterium]|nr:hypothetical protein [Deltaproteobacteria bacterium]
MKQKTPAVRTGKPEKNLRHEYRQIIVDHVTIWQAADVVKDEQAPFIRIRLVKLLFFKSLSVKGARADAGCGPEIKK